MTAAILTLAPYSPPDIAADVREALTPIDREHFEQHLQRASEIVARWPAWKQNLLGGLPTNDASRTLLLGSASQLRKTESGQSVLVPLYFIAALLTLSSGICLGQSDGIPRYKLPLAPGSKTAETPAPASGIFDGDIREAVQELREARKAQQELSAESREWRGLFKQIDGTRLKNLADRIGTLTWLVFWVLMVGISAWGLKQLASVAEAIGKVVTAWRTRE